MEQKELLDAFVQNATAMERVSQTLNKVNDTIESQAELHSEITKNLKESLVNSVENDGEKTRSHITVRLVIAALSLIGFIFMLTKVI